MKKIISKIKSVPYERRLIAISTVTTTINSVVAAGKILVGIFSDMVMCAVGTFNILLMIAKITCIAGERRRKPFGKRNLFTAVFLFFAGLVYSVYMSASLVLDLPRPEYTMTSSILIAAIAFTEMGVAVYGLIKTKRRGHYYRNIKIISFVSALIAIMTAQISLLSFSYTGDKIDIVRANACSGTGIGVITMLLAVYVYFAPQISTIDREHNVFKLVCSEKNKLLDMSAGESELLLCKSRIHGDYVFDVKIADDLADGHIKKNCGFWKGLPLAVKIIFIVLSEILVFVWAISYAVFFFRTIDMPNKLKKLMENNGFKLIPISDTDFYTVTVQEKISK